MEEGRELPVGWVETSLGDLIDRIEAGKNFRCIERPPSSGEVGVVKVSAVSWGHFRQDESKTVPVGVELSTGSAIKPGDLLFSRANTIDLVGACVQVFSIDKELHLSDKILRLITIDENFKPWMHRFLSSPNARKHLSEASSGNQLSMRNISQKVLLETAIPIAPLNDHHRIAAKLDTTLAAVDACRQRLVDVEAVLKRFRQAVLAAATSGELTRKWREKIRMDMNWKSCRLEEIAYIQGVITKDSKKQLDSYPELPYLRVANVQRGYLDLREIAFIRVPPAKLDSLLLKEGDILFNEGGDRDKVGRGWVWEGQIEACAFQNHVFRARLVSPDDQPKFVSWWSNTRGADHFLGEGKQTTNLASISKKTLGQLPIRMPPHDEQREIVNRVESLFSFADQLQAKLTAARQIVDRLTPSLLAKAFRGELVPQDPNDEPASELLARIRAARQADPAAGKPSRIGRRKAAATPETTLIDTALGPPDQLATLLRECGALSRKALLAASELKPRRFETQLALEQQSRHIQPTWEDGEELWEAVG
jgi:type I restriction enzyme S subunit